MIALLLTAELLYLSKASALLLSLQDIVYFLELSVHLNNELHV